MVESAKIIGLRGVLLTPDIFLTKQQAAEVLMIKHDRTLQKFLEKYYPHRDPVNKRYLLSAIRATIIAYQTEYDKRIGREPLDRTWQEGNVNEMLDRAKAEDMLNMKTWKAWEDFIQVTGLRLYPRNPFNPKSPLALCSWLDLQAAMVKYIEICKTETTKTI